MSTLIENPEITHKPKISKVKLPSPVTLRALVYRTNDGFVAECIDLNLMVLRRSSEEAAKSLESAVVGYVQTVLSDGSSAQQMVNTGHVDGLLPRPSPASHRLRYHLYCLRAALPIARNFQLKDFSSSQFPPGCLA